MTFFKHLIYSTHFYKVRKIIFWNNMSDKVIDIIIIIVLQQKKLTEENGKTTCFPIKKKKILKDSDLELSITSIKIIISLLMNLKNHDMKYFTEEIKQYNWIKDMFTEKPLPKFTITEEYHWTFHMIFCYDMNVQFSSYSFLGFWNNIKDEYSEVASKASFTCITIIYDIIFM